MHLLLAQWTVRWMSVMTGAAHATTALRTLARHAPDNGSSRGSRAQLRAVKRPRPGRAKPPRAALKSAA